MAEMYEKITTHVEDAKNRQVWQFAGKEKFETIIEINIERIQDLENIIFDLLAKRSISNSSGAQLDVIGEYLGLERGNLSDERYKADLFSSINKNKSAGQVNVLNTSLKYLTGIDSIILYQLFDGHVMMTVLVDSFDDVENQSIIYSTIQEIRAGGINIDITIELKSNYFTFSESLSGGNSGEGFATLLDGSDGGIFTRLLR